MICFERKINNIPEFCMISARKKFSFFLGGRAHAPSPTPMSTKVFISCVTAFLPNIMEEVAGTDTDVLLSYRQPLHL